LYEWIKPLNAMDAALRQIMKEFPALLLIGPMKKKKVDAEKNKDEKENQMETDASETTEPATCPQAESEADVNSVPPSIIHATSTILRFLSTLLRHAMQKSLFNSVTELSSLLAAADDGIAALALEVLSNLAAPPLVHRLQSQEIAQHTTMLHAASSSVVHARLMVVAKGWGTRGCDLGLATCVTTDDSASGQGALPRFAGKVVYDFLPPSSSHSVTVELTVEDIVVSNNLESDTSSTSAFASISTSSARSTSTSTPDRQNEKRRKMSGGSIGINGPASRQTKPTAHLFFQCLDQIGGRSKITPENLFGLLAHIRLAASFHSQALRTAAVQRRMHALISVLYAHPSQDVLAGYFHAQPELCAEIGDLVRPIVSPTAISATGVSRKRVGSFKGDGVDVEEERRQAAITSIVDPATTSNIPYSIRAVALEVFTALVARKDDVSGAGLSPVARQTNVLGELGVGKGQFLGLLPTLIRYSLASLNAFLSKRGDKDGDNDEEIALKNGNLDESFDIEELGLDLGLTFLEATKPPAVDKRDMEAKALEFVEIVLSLASSIVSVTTGTASLTDCGLVPALVSTIALTSHVVDDKKSVPFYGENLYCSSLLRFITAQSIQILEGAIITHNPALLAFHDLKAVDLLVTLLHSEFQKTFEQSGSDLVHATAIEGSTRVLLFSILNCLTVVFHHQETNPRSSNAPLTPADVLRRPEMTKVLMGIMKNVHSYGGVLGALATTILSDIMNSDPKIVHYVYECGLADTFFRMIKGSQFEKWDEKSKPNGIMNVQGEQWHEPDIPPSAELIMSLPNIIIALSLTEEGRKRVLHVNPIPELMSLMCTSKFSMPYTRCMLNDMASIIGSGLDEFMRHVQNSKSPVIKSLVAMIERAVYLGENIVQNECDSDLKSMDIDGGDLDCRICLMHYASNIGQALEHILQNEENCGDFVNAGGVDAILKLHPLLVVRRRELLAHISCQSSPTVANLSHSTAATSLVTAIKRCTVNDNPSTVIKKVMAALGNQLDSLEAANVALRKVSAVSSTLLEGFVLEGQGEGLNTFGILESIPQTPLNRLEDTVLNSDLLLVFSTFLLEIINTEWLSQVISEVIRVSCQRTSVPEVRSLDRNGRLEWQKDLTSPSFTSILRRLGIIYRTTMLEVCRVRSKAEYDEREIQRCKPPGESDHQPAVYRLRIVCCDGAVVRDGIDIDSCDSVTNLEMGEEVEAYDRCINRSGIMRYRTSWGWVSEQTRGHGREPISEVLEVAGVASRRERKFEDQPKARKPVDFGLPDLCSAGCSILARLQNSQCSLYASLSRVTMIGSRMRTSTSGTLHSPIASHIGTLVREISSSLRANFDASQHFIIDEKQSVLSPNCVSMYLGNMLSAFHSTLYEERRDKQYLNVLILCNSLYHDGLQDSFLLPTDKRTVSDEEENPCLPSTGFYGAIRYVMRNGLNGMKKMRLQLESHTSTKQRLSRAIASSFPSAVSLLRRLSSQSLLIDPQLGNTLQKMNVSDFQMFLDDSSEMADDRIFSFRHNSFARSVHCHIGAITQEFWMNPDLKHCPPYVLNSILSLVFEVLTCVEQSARKSSTQDDGDSDFRQHTRMAVSNAQEVSRTAESSTPPREDSSSNPTSEPSETNAQAELEKNEPVQQSETERKKDAEKEFDSKLLGINKACYAFFKDSLVKVGLDVIEGAQFAGEAQRDRDKRLEDLEESESCTVVASSFIIEICSRFPAERSKIVQQVLHRMIALMDISPKGSNANVLKGKDEIFATLCHSLVLFLRALPRTRIIVLENNLVSLIIHCLRSVTSKVKSAGFSSLPPWASPALLFLEVMAQPMALPVKSNDKDTASKPMDTPTKSNRRDDYEKVASEHKKQRAALSKTSKKITSALAQISKVRGENDDVERFTAFAEFPTFAPLINQESADHCLSICLQLLRHQTRQKRIQEDSVAFLPPSTAQATILLLTKILCYQKVSTRCLRMGGADFLLSLHPSSRFKGHVALVTLALRRMMEDESVLQTAMEIEIRSVVTKLLKKQSGSDGVSGKSFVKALGPFICRDPVVFFRAAATSINVKSGSSTDSEQNTLVVLLPAEERSRNARIINDCFRTSSNSNSNSSQAEKTPVKVQAGASRKKNGSSQKAPKNKSPLHRQSKKSQKKEKQEKALIVGTSVTHVTIQVLTETIKSFQGDRNRSNLHEVPFICVFEYLEILGDLLLAIPSCSAAICNYRIPGGLLKEKSHRNIIHYLLHSLLPQPREVSNPPVNNPFESDFDDGDVRGKKRENYMKIRIAQSSARLLVALVARVGEGRRKVISELSSALNEQNIPENDVEKDSTVLALQVCQYICSSVVLFLLFVSLTPYPLQNLFHKAWGELCLGLAAPRRTPASTDDSSLSFEVVKVMLEYGMAHSLMGAIKNVSLDHPQAPSTCANLLKPLEILTRPTVIDTLQVMSEKEEKKRKPLQGSSGDPSKSLTKGTLNSNSSSHQEGALHDGMLAADFDADAAASDDVLIEDGYESSSSEDGHSDDDDDDRIMMSDSEIEDIDSSESDSEVSESESDNDVDSFDDEDNHIDHMEIVDDDENIMSDSESEVESDDEEGDADDMHMDFEEAYDDDFQAQDEENDDFLDVDGEGDEDESGHGDLDEEGWTSIDSAGLGGMLFSSRNGAPPVGRPRQGGLMIEAAASVLNNILRSGEIQMDAIAEIEQSLGIRIPARGFDPENPRSRNRSMPVPRATGATGAGRNNAANVNDADLSPQNQGPIGDSPVIIQSNPPDNGFSSIGSIGRSGDTNFMEYLFGGPVFGPSRVYYDLHLREGEAEEEEDRARRLLPVPPSVDIQLFPGGPASCTHTRGAFCLHALLAGVSLAPLNSLLSINSRVDDQATSRPRLGGGWTEMVSNSRGNIIRLNRAPIMNANGNRPPGTFDNSGQALNSADASEFSQAFERTLLNFVPSQPREEQVQAGAENNHPGSNFFRPRNTGEFEEPNESTEGNNETSNANCESSTNNLHVGSTIDGEASNSSAPSASGDHSNEDSTTQSMDVDGPGESPTEAEAEVQEAVSESAIAVEVAVQLESSAGTAAQSAHNSEAAEQIESSPGVEAQSARNAEEVVQIESSAGTAALSAVNSEAVEQIEPSGSVEAQNAGNAEEVEQIEPSAGVEAQSAGHADAAATSNTLACPPGMDPEVFAQLPVEMQREIVGEQEVSANMVAELDEASGLDPEVLAALPEDMRREVIEQERNERRLREQENQNEAPADPARAEDLDGASFIASLAPDLREEILMTADDEFLNSLPPDLIAEAQLLRERALMSRHRREMEASTSSARDRRGGRHPNASDQSGATVRRGGPIRRRNKTKIRVDCNRTVVTYVSPRNGDSFGPLITPASMKSLVDLMYLLSPVRPQKVLQKLFQNLCFHRDIRKTVAITFIALLNDEPRYALDAIQSLEGGSLAPVKSFPSSLIGTAPEMSDSDSSSARPFFRRSRASSAATAIAMNLPVSAKGSGGNESLSPVVARRIIGTMSVLTKNASRLSLDILSNFDNNGDTGGITCLDTMLSLLVKPQYSLSYSNLEDLLGVIESICSPLSTIPSNSNHEVAPSKKDIETAASAGKEYVAVPRAIVSPNMLKLLCSILRLESCKDSLFAKVSNIARRLCRVEPNRKCVLEELASVAHGLGSDAIRDLRSLRIRLNNAVQVSFQYFDSFVSVDVSQRFALCLNRCTTPNLSRIVMMDLLTKLEHLLNPKILYQGQ
jgi:hypothetical protein